MRFKGIDLQCNPHSISIKNERNMKSFHSQIGTSIQELCLYPCVITGEGELYGNNSNLAYNKLQELFFKKESGLLFIPDYKPLYAFLSSLSMHKNADSNVMKFNFTFVEDINQNSDERYE